MNVALTEREQGIVVTERTAGHSHLGVEDFDGRLASGLAQQFQLEHGRDFTDNVRCLCAACEAAKCTLSSPGATNATIAIDSLWGSLDFCTTETRRFEEICQDLFRSVC